MAYVPTLRSFLPPPLRYEVHPIARLHGQGVLEVCGPWMPPLGPCLLVVWRPGEEPGFEGVRGSVRRRGAAWLVDPPEEAAARGPAREGWVVLWVQETAPRAPGQGF